MGDRRNKYGASPNMAGCPVETTLDVIGGKWKGIILIISLTERKDLMNSDVSIRVLRSLCLHCSYGSLNGMGSFIEKFIKKYRLKWNTH